MLLSVNFIVKILKKNYLSASKLFNTLFALMLLTLTEIHAWTGSLLVSRVFCSCTISSSRGISCFWPLYFDTHVYMLIHRPTHTYIYITIQKEIFVNIHIRTYICTYIYVCVCRLYVSEVKGRFNLCFIFGNDTKQI